MRKTSVHHVRPLSMYGSDHESNKSRIDNSDHNDIHRTLNINHDVLRKLRKKVNDVLVLTPNKLGIIQEVQKLYFGKMPELSEKMIYVHADSFTRQIIYRDYQIRSLLGEIGGGNYNLDSGRKQPPLKRQTKKEILDESIQKLYKLFDLEKERARRKVEYVQKVYNPGRKQ